jgi:DNA-binding NarL/FixJ family response regulator
MAHSNPISVLILHDDPVARVGLRSALSRYVDLHVVGDDDDSPADFCGDVVVADYGHATNVITSASNRTGASDASKVLIVTSCIRECEVRRALELGVRGYVLLGQALDELVGGIRAVYRGARYLCPQVASRLAEILTGDPLTSREEAVLRLVVEGLSNKAIARRLDIAVGTVKSHLKGVYDKLDVSSRTQAICAVERRGLLLEAPQHARREPVLNVAPALRARPLGLHRQGMASLAAFGS